MQSTLDRVAEWLARRSWYSPGPDGIPRLREVVELFLPSPDPTARVRVLLVRDDAPEQPVLYQLPLVERDALVPEDTPGLIGAGYGGAALFDGITDPAFAAALLAGIHESGHLRDAADDRLIVESTLVSDGATPVLRLQPYGRPALDLWLYRRVLDGPHPDAVAAEALADAGVETPRLAGVLPARWFEDGVEHSAHLAIARESASAVDGWRHAATAAGRRSDADVAALGRALAIAHAGLRARLGSRAATVADRSIQLGAWRTRLAGAAREIPGVADLAAALEETYAEAEALVGWPELQTVHGALELALTARTDEGEWLVRCFGGAEPGPVDERPELVAYDLAGLLRSLHYAGGLTGADEGWVPAQRRALLAGYASASAGDVPTALLDAVEADFAVVDAVWEARVRPERLDIPLAALRRIAATRRRDLAA